MKTGFLFGAGADGIFGIGVGQSFVEPLMTDDYKNQRQDLLKEKSGFKLVHKNSKKVFIQTICNHTEKARKLFDKEIVDMCIRYYEHGYSDDLKPLYDECFRWYDFISGKTKPNEKEKLIKEFFLENAVFFDTLDEKFNDLRNPVLGANGKKIVNAYYTIFLLMIRFLYEIPEDFEWTIDNLVILLRKDYDKIKMNESYYSILNSSGLKDFFVATSNYTYLAERITGKDDTIYLHGKLTWFEDYHKLQFYDVEKEDLPKNKSDLMPFIMIPSGVKPIICTKQLNEYTRFIQELSATDQLYVVGYRFNSEDNHINAIIADWLRGDGRQLIYFDYHESEVNDFDWSRHKWASEFSRKIIRSGLISDDITKIINIPINKDNSLRVFRNVVQQKAKNCKEGDSKCQNS